MASQGLPSGLPKAKAGACPRGSTRTTQQAASISSVSLSSDDDEGYRLYTIHLLEACSCLHSFTFNLSIEERENSSAIREILMRSLSD